MHVVILIAFFALLLIVGVVRDFALHEPLYRRYQNRAARGGRLRHGLRRRQLPRSEQGGVAMTFTLIVVSAS